jgi:hypothetical protein
VSKRTDSPGLGSLGSGALTAASMVFVSAASAIVGVVIAREFGRGAETDGLLAAYGVFVVIVIAAQAIRIAVLPRLARARDEERLAGELVGFALALAVFAVPLVLVGWVWRDAVAEVLTGTFPAQESAAQALPWMTLGAAAHLFAALAASGLAALDDYATAAIGYVVGSTAGLALILWRADDDGIVAVAWGIAVNGAVSLAIPALALAVRATRERMPARAVRPTGASIGSRIGGFAVAAALPLALQLLYLVCLAFAGRLETGATTSFVYAYLASAALVTITGSSIGLVTSVPLTRSGMDPPHVARHVVSATWLALALVAAAVGIFGLAGAGLVEAVLGPAYGEDVGEEVARLVVALGPWMVVSVGVAVAFPLAFVAERTRRLPWVAVGALLLQVPLAWLGSEWLALTGLAVALALSTVLVLAVLLSELGALRPTTGGILAAALSVAVLATVAFLLPALLLAPAVAAAVGLVAYAVLLALVRPRGLLAGWRYLRALG